MNIGGAKDCAVRGRPRGKPEWSAGSFVKVKVVAIEVRALSDIGEIEGPTAATAAIDCWKPHSTNYGKP
jgi:hypothetical protein